MKLHDAQCKRVHGVPGHMSVYTKIYNLLREEKRTAASSVSIEKSLSNQCDADVPLWCQEELREEHEDDVFVFPDGKE